MLKQSQQFCQRLKKARLSAGIKQEQAAAYLQVPVSAVSSMETGRRKIGAIELYQLSKLYCKSLDWFFSESTT